MSALSKFRGWDVHYDEPNNQWLFDDGVPVPVSMAGGPTGPCGHCGLPPTPEGHDGCLGTLPGGVMNACCGHGKGPERGDIYVQFWDSTEPDLRGQEALDFQRECKNTKVP